MTNQTIPLPKRFPGQIVARMKVWTKERNRIEFQGPYSDLAGDLLIAIMVRGHPKGKDRQIMQTCLDALRENVKKRRK